MHFTYLLQFIFYNIYVAWNQTFVSNKTFILWMLIDPGTSMLIRQGAVSTWH